jgi:hypothetical protein
MGNSMNSMKTYLLVWLGGVIAGVIIMERWRRTGRGLIPTAGSTADTVETATAADANASKVAADKPKVSAVLIAGAKADADRFRHFVRRVTPWTPDPSPARLRGWSRAPAPASAPDGPGKPT